MDEIKLAFRTAFDYCARWYTHPPRTAGEWQTMCDELTDLARGKDELTAELLVAVYTFYERLAANST